ncbi:ferredoxin [Basidiobolus meristosporus CBS 931.73]|uniref:Ferredoxin n=1 Tax=Basidiobolus meristosporus CBS 931.73 TaxID=1314790 RepID=A0A1Y1YFR4_9FUNG|nr:ferredoxin [Basidiobolus meristosporus CBS 931.73]|eukprot:ORX96825.1 ferredoxin [Basidiobolus meristosporus CBS 931.73]
MTFLTTFTRRIFPTAAGRVRLMSTKTNLTPISQRLTVNFVTPEGKTIAAKAAEGDSIMEIAHQNHIDLEGACEGSLACSTCHVILPEEFYDKLEEPSDEENDMLDLAFGLTDTSRLGCQVTMSRELDNITCKIPSATRNMAVDGYKPKPH